MELLTVVNNEVSVNPHILSVKEFATIWNSDKSKDKKDAREKLAYVYLFANWNSIYNKYTDAERHKILEEELTAGKKATKDILEAIEKYKEMQETPAISMLMAQVECINKVKQYFKTVDFSERDEKGQPVFKIKEVTSALKDAEPINKTLKSLLEQVKKEQEANSNVRGGVTVGQFAT